ncbi:diguanylate phosphodiesterase [Saccharobesus litoralis]|uniref:Diguanylate phosphodiesterase n=1 Tax=Saccharobesus litoralis TaxID=2172099 RepID=A0A2S0VLH3_9ALTE|nr:EAL domain-containing protein [Saccharobesus litoralis]AWB65064.1 diguanylate phosphodiesterase [Saccharobesus litoralis]
MKSTQFSVKKVMLVDDDEMVFVITKPLFNKLGINEVKFVEDGQQALDLIKQQHEFDLVILDLNMPNMDGIEFLSSLGAMNYRKPILINSGTDDRLLGAVKKMAVAHNLIVVDALTKPLSIRNFSQSLTRIEEVCASHNAPAQPRTVYEFSREELQNAIIQGEIQSYFQAQISVQSRKVVGAELLARWHHPIHGVISPLHFIPLAEQTGLIKPLSIALFEQLLSYIEQWHQQGYPIGASFNLSALALDDKKMPDLLGGMCKNAGICPSTITLEVTESLLHKSEANAIEVLGRFSLIGFNLSIDDFGTGYSSLEQLKMFPFEELKIDRSFVQRMETEQVSETIVESNIALGHRLGMSIVAEGVETERIMELMLNYNCDKAQGFLINKPTEGKQFGLWLKENWNKSL